MERPNDHSASPSLPNFEPQRQQNNPNRNSTIQEQQIQSNMQVRGINMSGEFNVLSTTTAAANPNLGGSAAMILPPLPASTVPTASSLPLMMSSGTTGRLLPFPYRLHHMLEDVERHGKQEIVSWMPFGRSFKVHDPYKFVKDVAPVYFNLKQYKSFKRQLLNYGFTKIESGHATGSYYHPFFIRDDPNQCHLIVRGKVTSKKQDSSSGGVSENSSGLHPYMPLHECVASTSDAGTSSATSIPSQARGSDDGGTNEDMFTAFMNSSDSKSWMGVEEEINDLAATGVASETNNESISSRSHPQSRLRVSTSLIDFQAIFGEQTSNTVQNKNQEVVEDAKMPALSSDSADNALLRYLQNPPPDVLSSTLDRALSATVGRTSTPTPSSNTAKQQQVITLLKQACNTSTQFSTVSWLLNGAASLSDLSQVLEGYFPSKNDARAAATTRSTSTNQEDDSLLQMSLECTTATGCEQFQDEIVSLFGVARSNQ